VSVLIREFSVNPGVRAIITLVGPIEGAKCASGIPKWRNIDLLESEMRQEIDGSFSRNSWWEIDVCFETQVFLRSVRIT